MKVPLLAFVCLSIAAVDAVISETNEFSGIDEFKDFFMNKLREVENHYEAKLKALRNEMSTKNEMLGKTITELNDKLDDKSNALEKLQEYFSNKESQLNTEIVKERDERTKQIDVLKETVLALIPGQITNNVSESALSRNEATKEPFQGSHEALGEDLKRPSKLYSPQASANLKRTARLYSPTQVAFSARLTNNTPSLSPNQDIVFDNVLLNLGSGYHSVHGTFIAPVPGIYVFTASILAYGTASHHANLVKNGQILAKIDFNDADGFDHSSQTLVVELAQGDDVAVQNADYNGMAYLGYFYSTFSGFLLYEYENILPIAGK